MFIYWYLRTLNYSRGVMLKRIIYPFIAVVAVCGGSLLDAATTATATVTFTIGSIDSITVSGNPAAMTVNAATAGSAPTSATDATTTFAVTTNNTARRITGAVDSTLPTGVTLSVALAAPTGATSAGAVALTTTAQALVTAIANIAQGSLTITYTLAATVSAVQVAGATRVVTYTVGP